jgi:hypothetical protein
MVYAMASIGFLGFCVWSRNIMALLISNYEVINITICWNNLVLIGTFNSKNLISYIKSAGNTIYNVVFSLYLNNTLETTRYTSFNFDNYKRKCEAGG